MKIIVAGGTGISFLKDLKVRIAFNRFDGDDILASVFPSTVKKNVNGQYEIYSDVSSSGNSDLSKIISKVEVESNDLSYYAIGLAVIIAAVAWLIFKK